MRQHTTAPGMRWACDQTTDDASTWSCMHGLQGNAYTCDAILVSPLTRKFKGTRSHARMQSTVRAAAIRGAPQLRWIFSQISPTSAVHTKAPHRDQADSRPKCTASLSMMKRPG